MHFEVSFLYRLQLCKSTRNGFGRNVLLNPFLFFVEIEEQLQVNKTANKYLRKGITVESEENISIRAFF